MNEYISGPSIARRNSPSSVDTLRPESTPSQPPPSSDTTIEPSTLTTLTLTHSATVCGLSQPDYRHELSHADISFAYHRPPWSSPKSHEKMTCRPPHLTTRRLCTNTSPTSESRAGCRHTQVGGGHKFPVKGSAGHNGRGAAAGGVPPGSA